MPNSVIYLSTVGYGTGALLGRGVEAVEAVHWRDELGLAQAMWVIRANRWARSSSPRTDRRLPVRARERQDRGDLEKVYEGTKPAVLKRLGEIDDRSEEMIG